MGRILLLGLACFLSFLRLWHGLSVVAVHRCTFGRFSCLNSLSDPWSTCVLAYVPFSQADQGEPIKILIVDYMKRKGVITWQLFAGGENLVGNNTILQTDATVFALTGATISMLEVRFDLFYQGNSLQTFS